MYYFKMTFLGMYYSFLRHSMLIKCFFCLIYNSCVIVFVLVTLKSQNCKEVSLYKMIHLIPENVNNNY